jgi:DNA-binding CsgD family transcriptional regulator
MLRGPGTRVGWYRRRMIGGRELRVISGVARAASEDGDPVAMSAASLGELRNLIPYACGMISSWDPVAGRHRVVVNDGYPDHTLASFFTRRFDEEMENAGRERLRTPTRMRDLPNDPESWWFIREILLPEGFKEGLSLLLFADGGRRYTGMMHLSTLAADHPSDTACKVVGALAPAFANLADAARPLRSAAAQLDPAAPVVGVRASGGFVVLPGLPSHPALVPGGHLEQACRRWSDSRWSRAAFLHRSGDWLRVRLLPAEPRSGLAAMVVLQESPGLLGLSARELEVLTLLATGASNPQIAARLVISSKTVSSHVGNVFEKLGVHTRTEAALAAVREGLLVAALLAAGELGVAGPAPRRAAAGSRA